MKFIVRIFLWLSLFTIAVQCQSLKNGTIIVTSVLHTPYTMLSESLESTGNDRYEGYIVDLIDSIAKIIGFKYVLKINEGASYGAFDRSSFKWNGLIGELVDGRSDIAAAAITITSERESAVDFTIPFMNLGIGVLYKQSILQRSGLDDFIDLSYPFKNYSTDAFLFLALVFGIILLILRRKYKTITFRILLGLWLLFLVIFVSLFIALLSSYYYVNNGIQIITREFHNVEELSKQSKVVYGCVKGGSTESFFRDAEDQFYSKMWSRMNASDPSAFVSNNAEGVERVQKGGYAFFAESTTIEYATARHCDLYQMGALLDEKGFGLVVQQGSLLREHVNRAIINLKEEGTLIRLKHKWWYERNGGGDC